MADVQGLYEKTRSAVRQSALIAEQLRMCNLDAGVREYQEFLQSFQSVTAALLGDDGALAARGIGASPDYIVEIMRGLLEAQEQKDYVLLADLLSLQAQPFLQELLEQIRSAEEQAFFRTIWSKTLGRFRDQIPYFVSGLGVFGRKTGRIWLWNRQCPDIRPCA